MKSEYTHLSQKGLTLIELLVTVAIIGTAAAVILPNLSSFTNRNELNNATKTTVAWLGDLRRQAIQNSVPCQATWNFDQASIEGSCGNQNETSNLDINFSTNEEVTVSNGGGSSIWIFTPRGTTNTSGQVIFKLKGRSDESGRCVNLRQPLGLIQDGKFLTTGSCDLTKSF